MQKTLFLVFGATGDLAKRKLFPSWASLFEKYSRENSPHSLEFIGLGRKEYTHEAFRNYLQDNVRFGEKTKGVLPDFLKKIQYFQVDLSKKESFSHLGTFLKNEYLQVSQIIIYLSIAPELFDSFIQFYPELQLGKNVRIIFEKPFGYDLQSSRLLQKKISEVFLEEQIYRIDHYIGKEAIQNIFSLRFGNTFFEPVWNSKYIDSIQIIASESLGVELRGEYYDKSGALRDMVQNHLFQVLSLVCMEPPKTNSIEALREEKLHLLQNIRLDADFSQNVVFGQYEGYKEEIGVSRESRTETFVALRLSIASPRWSGVPIYIKTGKALSKKATAIVITFRPPQENLFSFHSSQKNQIILTVGGNESIELQYNVRGTGNEELRTIRSGAQAIEPDKESYEKLLEDALLGDKTLFVSFEMLEATWKIIDELVNCRDNCPIVSSYPRGGNGPEIANLILERDSQEWYF